MRIKPSLLLLTSVKKINKPKAFLSRKRERIGPEEIGIPWALKKSALTTEPACDRTG